MNLDCCYTCGVVVNKDCIIWPDSAYESDDYTIDDDVCVWHNDDFHFKVSCPACKVGIIIGDIV
jgi:hypothetical protein